MRYTANLEASVLQALARAPDAHLRFQPGDYRPDGTIVVYRGDVKDTLHRRLYKLQIGPIPRGRSLTRICPLQGCVNPHHHRLVQATHPPRESCPNGHPYTKANTLKGRIKCRACRDARAERRKASSTRRAGYCKHNHKLTKSNVYRWVDVSGREHRRCKTCHLERIRNKRAGQLTITESNDD
jgi:hypothetical protein